MKKMEKLVEDIIIGDTIIKDDVKLTIKGNYEVNGEGIGFVAQDEEGKEVRFSKSYGVYLKVSV